MIRETEMKPADVAIACRNGGIVDLTSGERVVDGEDEKAVFLSYGDNAPIYVNLRYPGGYDVRLPNSELRRV